MKKLLPLFILLTLGCVTLVPTPDDFPPPPMTVITAVAVTGVDPIRATLSVIVDIPSATPVTRPLLLTVATIALLLDQVTPIVMGIIVVPIVPVTESC